MSRNGSESLGFLNDVTPGFSDPAAPTTAPAKPAKATVKVRTIRPHDTADGMRSPGDEYLRSPADAKQLAAAGVVELVETAKPKRSRKKS